MTRLAPRPLAEAGRQLSGLLLLHRPAHPPTLLLLPAWLTTPARTASLLAPPSRHRPEQQEQQQQQQPTHRHPSSTITTSSSGSGSSCSAVGSSSGSARHPGSGSSSGSARYPVPSEAIASSSGSSSGSPASGQRQQHGTSSNGLRPAWCLPALSSVVGLYGPLPRPSVCSPASPASSRGCATLNLGGADTAIKEKVNGGAP